MTLALIDFDTIAFRSAASCEPTKSKPFREPLDTAIQRADELVYRVLQETDTQEYLGYLSGTENFRKQLYPAYKANRVRQKPEWLDNVRNFLLDEWSAKVTGGYEADDAIGIAAKGDFVICANDKDFLQIPGKHYNFVKSEWLDVTEWDGWFNFYVQMLVGDASDNVPGVVGIGKVGAPRYLNYLDIDGMHEQVRELYDDDERFDLTYHLLRLLRSEDEYQNILEILSENKKQQAVD